MDEPPVLTTSYQATRAAARAASDDVAEPPSEEVLDYLASVERDENNRADIDASPWTCYGPCTAQNYCGHGTAYPVVRNSLVDLPYPHCTRMGCGTPNPASYDWRMTDISLYDINLDVPVFNQGFGSTCTQYACATATLLAAKLESTRHPHAPAYTGNPDVAEFVRRFYVSYRHRVDMGSSIPLTLSYIRDYGIPILNRYRVSPFPMVGDEFNLRIGRYWQADHRDVHLITRLLASGFPLVANIYSGRRFSFVNGDEVYDGPPPGGQDQPGITHTVALIGSGLRLRHVRREDNTMHAVYETYFVIRDSNGPFAHGSSARSFAHLGQQVGYDFNVWASSLREVWGIYEPRG